MQGEEGDHGTSVLHTTLLVGLILIGGLASREVPEQFGPRKCGQFSTARAAQEISHCRPKVKTRVRKRPQACAFGGFISCLVGNGRFAVFIAPAWWN